MDLTQELREVMNRQNIDGKLDTPDYILAKYLVTCLANLQVTLHDRDKWWKD